METRLGRRHFLAGVAAGMAVLAFDPRHQSWITAAYADHPGGIPIPDLDGELVVDPASLAEAADDFGHIIHRTPGPAASGPAGMTPKPPVATPVPGLPSFKLAHSIR